MHVCRSYRLEICWLALLLTLLLLTPRRSFAQDMSFFDLGDDCTSVSGWCFAHHIDVFAEVAP